MATLFQSFWSTNMSKRLLRYTLAKLDYFETDTLDLDNFDLAWGKKSQLTFQDVALKIPKIEPLLQLPPSIEIQKAKVLVLRITVPAAIHASPIVIEADGVEIKLKVASPEELKTSRRGAPKSTQPRHADQEEPVPQAIDLAQSFLDTQSSKEKAELQAALAAENQDLAASVASSEDGSEDDFPLGTGQPLSLPAFLADFLKGMVDRLQLAIKGIACQLDVEVPVEPNSTVNELVTFQLSIDEIIAEGVTTEAGPATNETSPKIIHKEGKRYVELNKIRACLISEANVFSALSRTNSMPSSAGANSPVMKSQQPVSRESSSASTHSLGQSLADPASLEQSHYHHPLTDSQDVFDIPYDFSGSNDDPDDEGSRSAPSTPRALAPQTPRPAPPTHPAHSSIYPPRDPWRPLEPTVRSEPSLEQIGRWGEGSTGSLRDDAGSVAENDKPAVVPSEDLTQSHLFSHEDAESMYMSAFSHAEDPSQPRHQSMPGAWDTEPSSNENYSGSKGKSEDTLPEITTPESSFAQNQASVAEENPALGGLETMNPYGGSPGLHNNTANTTDDMPADEAATPKGPTRLVKELISLNAVSLYLPSEKHQAIRMPSHDEDLAFGQYHGSLSRSNAPNLPGAFSVYEGAQSTASITETTRTQDANAPLDKSIEVMLSPMEVHTDLSTGVLLAMVVSRILAALKSGAEKTPTKNAKIETNSSTLPGIKIVMEKISIHLLETLTGVADTPERIFSSASPSFSTDALLTMTLEGLKVSMSTSKDSTVTSVDLGKFKFGYGNDDIVSFDQRIQMRASVRDALPSAGADISLKITQTPESTRCEAKTLPLHVKLDLQRLDETFSWFGGLSGFLNMSSSITSNASPTTRSPARTPSRPRGVRFEAPIRPDDTSASSDNKLNLRLGSVRLDLVGKDCSVVLDTSAVKFVSREEGIGVGISKIHLAGPYIRNSRADPPINIDVTNTRLEYLITPKDNDLERLLELIIPSKHKFDQNDNEIMVDTLLRQRRKGGVLRVNVDNFEINVSQIQQLQVLPALGEELARLSTVTKYLPEDDRPGILTLAFVRNVDARVDIDERFGSIQLSLKDIEAGHITIPSLVALGVGNISLRRNYREELINSVIPPLEKVAHGPVLTMRVIGDEMEPAIKLRMRHLNIEYRVPTIMDLLGLAEDATPQDFEATLAASVANLGEHAHSAITGKQQPTASVPSGGKNPDGKPTKVDLVLRDCLLGLNPLGLTSKLVIALTDTHVEVSLSNGDDINALGHINKASVLLIDDVSRLDSRSLTSTARRRASNTSTPQIVDLCQRGYVDVCYISAAKAIVKVGASREGDQKWVDIELRDDLLVLETCADSTQTLIALANALSPPTPPSKEIKYRTNIVPVEDLLASISADAFGRAEGEYDFDDDFGLAQELSSEDDSTFDFGDSGHSSPLAVDSNFYGHNSTDELVDTADSVMSERTTAQDTNDGVLLTNFSSQPDDMLDEDEGLEIHENYFGSGSIIEGTAHRWNSAKNEYDQSNYKKIQRSPVAVRVRDVHFIWNLFDGYDWDHTRDVISKAVYDIETTATERQSRHDRARASTDKDSVEEERVIGDFLFNSIYIGIPANRDPRELAQAINQELNDNATETESIATTAVTATPSRQGGAYRTKKKLKLNRSKRHKITFELKGINIDLVTFLPGSGETQSSVDVRVKDLDVFDHVPTSTWKKFATYNQDAGERELGTSMLHLEILNVKPIPELAASEIVLKVTVLPLRLHVDQDALDFIMRFFEFKDDSAPTHASPSDIPFVQRAEVNSIPVTLDFKPKRVDYAGLKSGHTTEFMNFLVLDQARLVLRHTIIYGVSGFDRLGQTLNDIWSPDVRRNQLPGVLAGLAPVRSLVNVGSGFKDLVEIPIKEYRKDGRIVRSIGKGATAFAKTTGTELVKLGAKLAVGTQYALQTAEGILVKRPETREVIEWEEEEELDPEEAKQISLYANQPTGVVQGLRGAYSSLARDLNVARDAIIAVPGEVMDSQSAQGAAKAVLKRAPTIIFRPLIGSSKAIGQTLMGATNSLDPQNRRRMDEKYKRH